MVKIVVGSNLPSLWLLFERILEPIYGKVYCATNMEEILDLCNRLNPDLLILDGHRDNFPGGEMCRIVKGSPATAEIKVLITSSISQDLQKEGVPADRFLPKPYDIQSLLTCVGELTADNNN